MLSDKHEWIPPVNFFFTVEFFKLSGEKDMEVSFSEVSGLCWRNHHIDDKYEKIKHSCGELVLKRPLGNVNQDFTKWVWRCARTTMYSERNIYNVIVKVLDSNKEPVAAWFCSRVYPESFDLSGLNSTQGEILFETVKLKYERLKRQQ